MTRKDTPDESVGTPAAAHQTGLEQAAALQAEKIKQLLHDNEELAADRAAAKERLGQLLALLQADEAAAPGVIAELQSWKRLGATKLAPSLQAAEHQADILWSYVRAMESPGHRLLVWLGTRLGANPLKRRLKRAAAFLLALKRS